jgi:hypothetical protein
LTKAAQMKNNAAVLCIDPYAASCMAITENKIKADDFWDQRQAPALSADEFMRPDKKVKNKM